MSILNNILEPVHLSELQLNNSKQGEEEKFVC